MIGGLATYLFDVYRRSSTILAETPAEAAWALAVNCPEQGAFAELTVRGSSALSGTITVTGEVAGIPDTEVLAVAAVGASGIAIVRTTKRFSCFTAISTTGLDDEVPVPTVQARAIGAGGEAVHILEVLATAIYGHREDLHADWRTPQPGSGAGGTLATIDHDDVYGFAPRRGDLYLEYRDGAAYRTWEVDSDPPWLGDGHHHHWELRVRHADDRSTTVVSP